MLAAAVRARASVLVTWNTRDFPNHACAPYRIIVQTPDEFLCYLWHVNPEEMAATLRQQAARLSNPLQTLLEVVGTLQQSVPQFAATVLRSGTLD